MELLKMGSLCRQKCWCLLVCVLCVFSGVKANAAAVEGTVLINGKSPIAKTDDNFICATLDWWPPDKCDYGTCSWGRTSLLNLDLKNPILLNAVKALSPLKMRLGGSLEDKVTYQTEGSKKACTPFVKNSTQLFGFSEGCMPLARWDDLNSFFSKSGALVIFGLNALNGKLIHPNHTATGPWDSSNAASLIRYTAKKGYQIYGWELGNELCGKGIGVGIAAGPYASDTIALHNLVQDIYKGFKIKPKIIGPGGFFDPGWFKEYIAKTVGSLSAVTHHIYNLGAGKDEHLIDRILNTTVLDSGAGVFKNLQDILRRSGTSAAAWVGESGGAYNSGRDKVTNAFVFSFWYLDQLGLASVHETKTYCRQSLIGGNYGLLDSRTFVPNPDFYSALLWHRLMSSFVLSTNFLGTKKIRAYSHCAKQSQGITLLLINLDSKTTVHARPKFNGTVSYLKKHAKQVPGTTREEYHLTPTGGDIQSQTVRLNGKTLTIGPSGSIPSLEPVTVASMEPVTVAPYSIVFVHMPNVVVSACK